MVLNGLIYAPSVRWIECLSGNQTHQNTLANGRFDSCRNFMKIAIEDSTPFNKCFKQRGRRLRRVVNSTQEMIATLESVRYYRTEAHPVCPKGAQCSSKN